MKHGSGSEGEHLHSTSSISPSSPGFPQLWEVSMANKGAHMHPNNYMNSFGHWYPSHQPHQDAMPRPQMMWVGCFDIMQAWCSGLDWTCSRSCLPEVNCVKNKCLIELSTISFKLISRCKIRPGLKYIYFFRYVIMSLTLLVHDRKLTEMWTLVCAVYSG